MKAGEVLGGVLLFAMLIACSWIAGASWVMVHDVPRKHEDPTDGGNGFVQTPRWLVRTPRVAPSALHGLVFYRERGMNHTRAEQWDNGRCVIAYNITDDGFARIVECGR